MSLGSLIGGADGYGFIPAAMGIVGSSQAQKETNEQNVMLAREQMAFQERMSSTAYQRATEDMRKAGINPMLAVSQGGASSPSGSLARVENPIAAGMGSAAQAAQTAAAYQQAEQSKAQVENIHAQTDKIKSETLDQTLNSAVTAQALKEAQFRTKKIEEETRGVRADADSKWDKLSEERRTDGPVVNSAFAADVRRRKAEASLREMDIPRAKAEEEFYKGIGDISPYLRMLLQMLTGAGQAARVFK